MIRSARLPLSALLSVLAAAAACKKDKPTELQLSGAPPRAELNGSYDCVKMFAFYPGPQGTNWYTSTCSGYRNTFPARRDSIETMEFQITPSSQITRLDFEDGSVQYDTASAELVANYAHRGPDFFLAGYTGNTLQLRQEFVPFDFSGDGQPDSLVLVFSRTSR